MKLKFNLLKLRNPSTKEFENFLAIKGDKGDKGDTGATGPQGPQGIPGISATISDETLIITTK